MGISFQIWNKSNSKEHGLTSLMGNEKKRPLKNLPAKFHDILCPETAEKTKKLWDVRETEMRFPLNKLCDAVFYNNNNNNNNNNYYYYYYCLYYHSLCWCSFCASAGRKPCTWGISHSSQSFCSDTKHLLEDSCRSQHADLLNLCHSSSL